MFTIGRGARWRMLSCILLAGAGIAQAQDESTMTGPFTVTGIRVEGLQRITEGTLFNTLPVNVGDRLDSQRVREALRAVYGMGFFRDVQMRRETSGVLVVVVQESPSIRSFAVKGNKDIINRLTGFPRVDGGGERELIDLRLSSFATEDFKEGVRAFGEKRKPVWKGK